ncbi:NUDIX hydrolase [Flavobacteriaceae bacterium Ap0902]|nr:NUDIX hydrolase [Flavobacteriaceae bacterium Ap0902]
MDFRKIENISVDCVILTLGEAGMEVLLRKRKLKLFEANQPDIDDWTVIGDQVLNSEKLDLAADRIFNQAATYNNPYKKQFKTFGSPERIHNEQDIIFLQSKGLKHRIISVAYYFLVSKEVIKIAKDTKWHSVLALPKLGFDHEKIIRRALEDLKIKATTTPIIFHLIQDKFTLNDLHFAYESLLNIEIDNRNFRKKALNKTYIVPLAEKRAIKGAKKPAKLYMFSHDIYKKLADDTQANYLNFSF